MKTFRLWMLAATLICGASVFTSCSSDNDDNPATNPDEPQQQLADYTIIYYGHGGGNLDIWLMRNIGQFFQSDTESRKNVSICAQFKFSTLKAMQETYEDLRKNADPNNLKEVAFVESIKDCYPYAEKTTRFVVAQDADTEEAMNAAITGNLIGPDNADISRADSLTNFINWAAKTCPARKYILIMSDHGGGYLPHAELPSADAAAARQTRGVIYDNGHNGAHFTAKTLAQAISHASVRPSVVYCDACLMNTVEYHFELAPVTDYLMLSTFLVPGDGGNYTELVEALSANPDDLEQALKRFAKFSVAAWDKDHENDSDPYYHDLSIYRTADIDAFGAALKTFTDRLTDAYQNGGDEVRAKIDEVTANAYRVESEQPEFDLMNYLFGLYAALPDDVFGDASITLAKAYSNYFVQQENSKWLIENGHTVSLSVLLGCQGHYILKTEREEKKGEYDLYLYDADGKVYLLLDEDGARMELGSWQSTLDATYGQLRFDNLTGWSRWLKLNQQEPNLECFVEPYTAIWSGPKGRK
ncbi:MAG: hypothetical protein ILA25_08915 [Prevotella sp.]|nr:hypothetical protein [Prevotella sp.]